MARRAGLPWWYHLIVFAGLFAAGLGIGELVEADRQIRPDDLDHRVSAWVVTQRPAWPGLTRVFRLITRIGDWEVGIPLVLAGGLLLAGLHRLGAPGIGRAEIGFWVVVAVGARLLCIALKAWFQRERPPLIFRLVVEDSYSFPSSHSLTSAACFAVGAVLLARALSGSPAWHRAAVAGVCLVLVVLISASRIWLGVHYLSDVLGGLFLGLGWACAACVIHFGPTRWTRPGPEITIGGAQT